MSKSRKHEENLQRIQNVLDDKHEVKIQVGAGDQESKISRKVGDRWTDSVGVEWEQKNGYRSKITKIEKGIFAKQCDDCGKNCIKKRDTDTYNRMSRCFECQVNFEAILKSTKIGENNNKWFFWVKLKLLQRWESMDIEENLIMLEVLKENQKLFDKSVSNALANSEVDTSMKINKKMTGN